MLEVNIKRKLEGFKLDVSFSVSQEILAILGPSGSGKTMTLQCIAGLIKPDEGYIALNGKILFDSSRGINLPPQERKIGFVFQNYALFPHFTVEENIAYGINHLTKKEMTEKVALLLGKMHIQGLGKRYPRQLSSGQQQRVALARSLAPEPELLLLDEPFSALDTMRKERLELELMSLQQSYKGNMLFVTHDLAQGYKLSTRMAIFEAGRIIQCDAKDRVIELPANRTVARLAGVKNLISGTVSDISEQDVLVNVKELGITLKAGITDTRRPVAGQTVTVGIRPEYVRLASGPGENTIRLCAGQVVEGVTATSCRFQIAGTQEEGYHIEANLPKADGRQVAGGQKCYLYLPPEHLVIIME